jgi:hypothetical protein
LRDHITPAMATATLVQHDARRRVSADGQKVGKANSKAVPFNNMCKEIAIPTALPFLPKTRGNPVTALRHNQVGVTPVAPVTVLGLLSRFAPPPPSDESKQPSQCEIDWDSDEEEMHVLCSRCHLPVGEQGYAEDGEEDRGLMHAECKAQLLLRDARKEDEARLQKDAAVKAAHRVQYDIGWNAKRIPLNQGPASKLGAEVPKGFCGLLWDEAHRAVKVVPASDPASSVNLEYLAIALQVRREEGREVLFSLDPKDASLLPPEERKDNSWQTKRFEPAWLAGTSVGDVLFQADFHLKELSMGEYTQPVVGMKSALDFSEEEGCDKEWSAREWFVVKQAQMLLSEGNLLMPSVQMGVEAREQVFRGDGTYEDVPLTREDHPCVRYADAFTRNFDLIAERKSVVFHLRELAKCSVLAKFLQENDTQLEDGIWFGLAGSALEGATPCCREVPQLWNERGFANIRVTDGKIDTSVASLGTALHGVYGGVEFGVERLGRVPAARVSAAKPVNLTARLLSVGAPITEMPIPRGPEAGVVGAAPMSFAALSAGASAAVGARALGLSAAQGMPQGVDLNLNGFDLSSPVEAVDEIPAGNWVGEDFFGSAFWSSLPRLPKAEADLLAALFNPHLCDRRDEGDLFIPPSASLAYALKLHSLLCEEAAVLNSRQEHFFSKEFIVNSPGPLFPPAWTPRHGIAGQTPAPAPQDSLHPRPDYRVHAAKLVKSATPVFEKTAEDGTRFLVYKIGTLEVRATQAHDGEQVTGAVYSKKAVPTVQVVSADESVSTIPRTCKVVKAVEYVEEARSEQRGTAKRRARHYYVVLETEQGDVIMTEKLQDGSTTWAENPEDLEARNSLAKVIKTGDWSDKTITVGDMLSYQSDALHCRGSSARLSERKNYAHSVLLRALPAWSRTWASLAKAEREHAERLGISDPKAWDEGTAEVLRLTWSGLSASQQEAAHALGTSRAFWDKSGRAMGIAFEKSWSALTQSEREAAQLLGVDGAKAWEEMPWDKEPGSSVWEQSWARLSSRQRGAAAALGLGGAGAWDETAWMVGGAWEQRWARLTEAEQQAAKQLGVSGAEVWDAAFGEPGKKGQGLAGVWEKSWASLTHEERRAAWELGIAGAGAWDASQAVSSWEKQWAQLSEAEQQAKMESWYKQTCGSLR